MAPRIKLPWNLGVNLLVDPAELQPGQLANAKNCWPTVEGIMVKRPVVGCISPITNHASIDSDSSIVALARSPYTIPYVVHSVNRLLGFEQFALLDGTQFLNVTYVNPVGVLGEPIGTAFKAPAQFLSFRGRLIGIRPGQDCFFQLNPGDLAIGAPFSRNLFTWDAGTAGTTAGQTQSVPIQPNVICSYRDRLVYGNLGPGFENVIIMSDRTPPVGWTNVTTAPPWAIVGNDVLADNGRHFRFSSIQGETIRAMMEVSMGSVTNPLQTALLILTERSALICTGEPAETTDGGSTFDDYIGDFQFPKVNYDCGVASAGAICKGPNGTFWANGEDVYALYDAQPRPIPIGTGIRPALNDCPESLHHLWTMTYAEGSLYLAIATQNSAGPLDPDVNHWRLDLRPPGQNDVAARPAGPSEARWWGPQQYSTMVDAGVEGALSCAMVTVRRNTRNVVVGLWLGGATPQVTKQFHLISYNEAEGGRDVPYNEIVTGRTWTANDYVPVGDVVMPSPLRRNGHLYVCSASAGAHTTSGVEPTWPLTSGGTVVDGDITWKEISSPGMAMRLPNVPGDSTFAVSMEPDFPEYGLGTHTQDKVFKRADLAAFLGFKQQVWLECALNGGNFCGYMGPAIIGDFTLGKSPAINDLGNLELDYSAAAEEYQARTLRPCAQAGRDRVTTYSPGVVRGMTIQPKFREGTGIQIDDSNDYIVWCSASVADGLRTVRQAQVPHGYYTDVDELLGAIIVAMNVNPALTGFTLGANPWNYDSAFVDVYPYMTTLTMAFSARTGGNWVAFLACLDQDQTATIAGVQVYLLRSMNLLALLGYDTSTAWNAAAGLAYTTDQGLPIAMVAEQSSPVLASPTRICGVQSIPFVRPTIVKLAELEGEFLLKRGRPFSKSSRKS